MKIEFMNKYYKSIANHITPFAMSLLKSISVKSKLNRVRVAFLLLLLSIFVNVEAATYYSRNTGNWNSNTTWSTTSGGSAVGTGVFPGASDNVVIEGGFNVTLTTNASCSSVTFTT